MEDCTERLAWAARPSEGAIYTEVHGGSGGRELSPTTRSNSRVLLWFIGGGMETG